MIPDIIKYPRTYHIEGSRLQPGDEGMGDAPIADLAGRHIVVEEKLDGGNAGISFGPDGALLPQSRGHYLSGGPRERHDALFKRWAYAHASALWDALGDRYIVYVDLGHVDMARVARDFGYTLDELRRL